MTRTVAMALFLLALIAGITRAAEPKPPEGFRAIFNGKDLSGWYGLNPHSSAKLTAEKKEANLKQQREDFPTHWKIENGELVNSGTGPYATTDAEFGDIELLLEYKTVAKADSGVYLRGTPQVQIWDSNQKFDPKKPDRKPHLGSGGLFNNTPDAAGRDPLVLADKPFGEWNQFRIRQIGARTWVWLNGKQVVDGATMENFWDRSKPLPAKGPIMLQTHGGEIRWRNLFVREISAEEASKLSKSAADRPNVVLVMADDQGWGDTGYNGHADLKTPNLDDLAKSGLRLNRFYTAHFNCSPTRASIMTGRSPSRMGTFRPGAPIKAQELTVAKVLQSSGYATGHFGKWHLNGKNGDKNTTAIPGRAILAADPLSPGRMGFDEWVSADNFFDLDPVLGRNGVPEKFHGDSSDVTTDEALKFIRKQAAAGNPFLSVVWFGSPHVPHSALPADKALYSKLPEKEQNYYGEITAVDRSVGRLRTALRDLKLTENTIFWYCSDNGGHEGPKSTGNLRGEKGTMWEGGLRVPCVVEWPARIPKPAASDVPCCTIDMYPTLLEATGSLAQNQIQPLDGISLIFLFESKMEARSKPIPFWAHAANKGGHAVLLDWPYKLHVHPVAGRGKDKGEKLPATMLFDVSNDAKETADLALKEPERIAKMKAQLEAWQDSVEKSLSGADYAAKPKN